jgi:hypothetical protein
VGDRFELVVDVQLRTHEHKAERVDAAGGGADRPGVPAEVLVVDQRAQGIGQDEWEQRGGEIPRGKPAAHVTTQGTGNGAWGFAFKKRWLRTSGQRALTCLPPASRA